MSDSWDQLWSNSSAAPQISKYDYTAEKATLAGSFISMTLYGTSAHMFLYSSSLQFFGLL